MLVDKVMKRFKSDETKTIVGCESVSSLPMTVTRVPPACGPNSGHTSLAVGLGPSGVPQHITRAKRVAVMEASLHLDESWVNY